MENGINIVISSKDGIIIDKYGFNFGLSHVCLVAKKVIVNTSKEERVKIFGGGSIIPGGRYKVRIKKGIEEWRKLNDEDYDEADPGSDQCV